jgi:hypothetical protein
MQINTMPGSIWQLPLEANLLRVRMPRHKLKTGILDEVLKLHCADQNDNFG